MNTGSTVTEKSVTTGKDFSKGLRTIDIGQGRYMAVLAAILCLAAVTYCSLASFWPKFSRAEVFFAECAREMLSSKNFITPLYHGQPFFDKPILVYWLIISMFKVFGPSHLAARIPSIVCALGTLLLTGFAGAALHGRRSGLIAASMLATSFMFLSFASLCMSDMLLVFLDTLSLSLLFSGIRNAKRRDLFWFCASISTGLAFLTKGPIGIVLPLLTFFSFLALTRQLGILGIRHAIFALVTIALVCSPWFIAVFRANGVSALLYFFVHENLERFTGSQYDARKPFWYPIASLFYGFAPWSIFLPPVLLQFVRSIRRDGLASVSNSSLFLWLWISISVGFFCFSRGKCDYYTLPAYPAAAILIASFIEERLNQKGVFLRSMLVIFAIGFLVSSLGCYEILISCADSTWAWWTVPISLFISGVAMVALLMKNRLDLSLGIAAVGIAATTILFSAQILPDIASMEPIGDYARLVNSAATDTRVGVDKSLHGWIDEISFQTGRHPSILGDASEVAKFLNGSTASLVLIPQDRLEELPAKNRSTLKVLSRANVITHALTPGYVFQRGGNLRDPVAVVMVASPGAAKSGVVGGSQGPQAGW